MHGQTLQSILDNYKELMELWEWSLSVVSETEWRLVFKVSKALWENLASCLAATWEIFCCLKQTFKNNPKTGDICNRSAIIGQEHLKCSSVRPIWWKLSALLGKSSALQSQSWCRWHPSVKKEESAIKIQNWQTWITPLSWKSRG